MPPAPPWPATGPQTTLADQNLHASGSRRRRKAPKGAPVWRGWRGSIGPLIASCVGARGSSTPRMRRRRR
eukprot:3668658-Pyramimonas_sp.AAC.1